MMPGARAEVGSLSAAVRGWAEVAIEATGMAHSGDVLKVVESVLEVRQDSPNMVFLSR